MSDLPAGLVAGAAPTTATTATTDTSGVPSGLVPGAPPGQGWWDWTRNVAVPQTRTALAGALSDVIGLPNTIARLGDVTGSRSPETRFLDPSIPPMPTPGGGQVTFPGTQTIDTQTPPGFLTRHTLSPAEAESDIYGAGNWWRRQITGQEPVQPYEPQTDWGRLYQKGTRMGTGALLSGGTTGIIPRTVAGVTGGLLGEEARQLYPNSPYVEPAANILGFLTGGALTSAANKILQTGRSILSPSYAERLAEPRVASDLAISAGLPGSQVAQTIGTNLPQWTPGTRPTLGDVTENTGLRARVYQDQTAAQRAAAKEGGTPSPYPTNLQTTYQAQREAVAGATPSDAATKLAQLQTDLNTAVAGIPEGTTAQQAGNAFRDNLAQVKAQREATRAAGGSEFDALAASQGRANPQPVIDYATAQAAQNAGTVGDAYKAAANQFKSATGITLDTAQFSNSVLKGLGDLAEGYGRQGNTAAQRAVLDVRDRFNASLSTDIPEVGQARATWATNSRPLDVFEQAPFGRILKQDQYGRSYLAPSDEVAETMLRSKGTADALDKTTEIFGDFDAATRALQDHIASKVKQPIGMGGALQADGSIDLGRMQSILKSYQPALMRFPNLQKQFSTVEGAQTAFNQQSAYQKLYDTVSNELGTRQTGAFSNNKFQNWLKDNSALIDQAYSPEQAAVIRRVGKELDSMAQTQEAKVPATSGTAQLMPAPEGGRGGAVIKTILGILGAHAMQLPGETGAMLGSAWAEASKAGLSRSQIAYNSIMRQALTDPAYARSILLRYDPSGVNSTAAERAMRYVGARTPWVPVANIAGVQTPAP